MLFYCILELVIYMGGEMNQFLNILCDCPLFQGKEKLEIENILSQTQYKIRRYKKNELILRTDQSTN